MVDQSRPASSSLSYWRAAAGSFRVVRDFVVDFVTRAMQPHGALRAARHQAAAFDVTQQRAIEFHHRWPG